MSQTSDLQNPIPELMALPLPLAQTLRRALNASSPEERHRAAYFFFESSLKLAAAAQIGLYVQLGCPDPELNLQLENLVRPSVGQWLGFLRDISKALAAREDAATLPLAGVHERLTRAERRPAARDFLDFAGQLQERPDGRKNVSIQDLFDAIVQYRNDELGHGAQRPRGVYAKGAELLLKATLEALQALTPFGELSLALARDALDPDTGAAFRQYELLRGDGVRRPLPEVRLDEKDRSIVAGRLVLASGNARISLHPLLVYEADERERDRIGFLNKVTGNLWSRSDQAPGKLSIRKVDYLDYDSGERLKGRDAATELAALLGKLRGKAVTVDEVNRLAQAEEGEPQAPAGPEPPKVKRPDTLQRLRRGYRSYRLAANLGLAAVVVALAIWWTLSRPSPDGPLAPLALHWYGFGQRCNANGCTEIPVRDGTKLMSGDQFRMVFVPTEDCYAYVLNQDSDGKTTVLFPHKQISANNRMRRGQEMTIPDGNNWFTLDDKPGTETFYILASYDPLENYDSLVQAVASGHNTDGVILTRGGKQVHKTRSVGIEPDKTTEVTLKDGRKVQQTMELSIGAANVGQRIQFRHEPLP